MKASETVLPFMRHWALLSLLLVTGCHQPSPIRAASTAHLPRVQQLIVEGARDQLSWGTAYDASYCRIPYPNGDVPRTKGACTDVVIRALRHSGIDLQELMHKDMAAHWSLYPRYADRLKPDSNIDHRRVPNQKVFFTRFGDVLTKKATNPKEWQPGDIIEWKIGAHDHTGVLTDHSDTDGFPLVIHNIGGGPMEEDVIRCPEWSIAGHFRFPKSKRKPTRVTLSHAQLRRTNG